MKIDENGIIREMTQEEIWELEQLHSEQAPSAPSLEEKVLEQEKEINNLKEALNALLEKRVQ